MTTPSFRPLKVLYHMHHHLDTLDLTGPLEIFSHATLPSSISPTPSTPSIPPQKIFHSTLTSSSPTSHITTGQNLSLKHDIPLSEAYARLDEFDILVIPGGGTDGILEGDGKGGEKEPMGLIKAFCGLGRKKVIVQGEGEGEEEGSDLLNGERILFSVCTGSLFLATAGIFSFPSSSSAEEGLRVTTHPKYYEKLKVILGEGKEEGGGKGEKRVVKNRFVVNKVDEENGLRVITCGGVTSGFDGALWVVERVGGRVCREGVEGIVIYEMRGGGLVV